MPSKSSPAFFGLTPATKQCLAVGVLAAHPRVELAGLAGDALRDDLVCFC